MSPCLQLWRNALCLAGTLCLFPVPGTCAPQVRSRATLDLTMQASADDAGALLDEARSGALPDKVSVRGDVRRIPSILGRGHAGHSLMFNASGAQYLSIDSSADVSCADAVTVSGVFASLNSVSVKGYGGLFAKRQPDGKNLTNYGINYDHASDVLQLYVNGGSGYRIARFSVKQVLGSLRRVHLTVTFRTADAPHAGLNAADEDTDADDLEMRLFVNGTPIAPAAANQGFVQGTSAWLTDLTLASCVSDTPLTLAASFADAEPARVIADDFLVFPEALTDADVATLFREVCGEAADDLLAEQSASPTAPQAPEITVLSTRGFQVGTTSPLVVEGKRLGGIQLHFSSAAISARRRDGATAERAVFDVTVAENATPARCLVYAVSEAGVSAGQVLCMDRLRQVADGELTRSNPLPSGAVAVSGVLSGTQQKQVWFQAQQNDVIVAEIEARRLGSSLEPVVEIRNAAGAPLAVQWQQAELGGDARARIVVPEAGLYCAEVHDLRYRAPGNSPWRLLLGPLHAAALSYPSGSADTAHPVALLGSQGASASTTTAVDAVLPVPPLADTSATDAVEPLDGHFPESPFDAKFTAPPYTPLSVWGRIAEDDQTDTLRLAVTPGQTLYCTVFARRISSPLRPEVILRVGDNVVARSTGDNGASDPSVAWTVPEKVEAVTVQIRDFTGRGSPSAMYRMDVSRSDRPGFRIQANTTRLRLPRDGAIPLRLQVQRKSESFQYDGPIHLSIPQAVGIQIVPPLIAPGTGNGDALVMLVRDQQRAPSELTSFVIEASTSGLEHNVTERVHVAVDADRLSTIPEIGSTLLTVASPAVPAVVSMAGPPPVLFRGTQATIPLRISEQEAAGDRFLLFSMETNQPLRREKPDDPDSPLRPRVAAEELQFTDVQTESFDLQITTPLDTPENSLTAVVSAAFVDQPLAHDSDRRAWTAPIGLTVRNAATLVAEEQPASVVPGGKVILTPRLEVHPLFDKPVELRLNGLPEGWQTSPPKIAAGHFGTVRLEIVAAAAAPPGPVAGVSLTVLTEQGVPLTTPVPVALNVTAPAK